MLNSKNIIALCMERQCLTRPVNETEYLSLYHDTQPGQNVYWHGFGDPPSISFRADFDDIEYNRERQRQRILVKGRFQGGNLGWIERDDMELFTCLTRKPLNGFTEKQQLILELIEHEGPMNIQLIKEITGMLVKEITPILHRLQEAFLIYEDQYDGEWDRGWFRFAEMFPTVNPNRYTRHEALNIILQRFSFRIVFFTADMAKSFYKLPAKDIKLALNDLVKDNILIQYEDGYMLKSDFEILDKNKYLLTPSCYVMHRNDFLVKANEYRLKMKYKNAEHDILQYILVDGEFVGAVVGKFKYGPYIIENLTLDAGLKSRQSEIILAVNQINSDTENPAKQYNVIEI